MIQKTIRGFMARKVADRIREEELIFLGMLKKPQDPNDPKTALYKMNKNREKVHEVQAQNEKDYKETLGSLKEYPAVFLFSFLLRFPRNGMQLHFRFFG